MKLNIQCAEQSRNLLCDSCTLCTEPPIHIGIEAWITGRRTNKWSNSESPCFHAFKIAKTKLMVIKKKQPNKSKENKDDPYWITVLVTTLGQQTSWLILCITDKKVSITIFFYLIWMYLTHSVSYLCAYVSTSSTHCSWFADGELLLGNALSFHMKLQKVSPFSDFPHPLDSYLIPLLTAVHCKSRRPLPSSRAPVCSEAGDGGGEGGRLADSSTARNQTVKMRYSN